MANRILLSYLIILSYYYTTHSFFSSPKLSHNSHIKINSPPFHAKKKKKGGGQAPQEKASVKEQRLDAATRQFIFTILGVNKILPDKSKEILKNINLCFYPGAKIGLVGLNGSGKSTLLRIMAGLDEEFDGTARPLPGISIGYLPQEPKLEFETVQECVDDAVKESRKILEEYNAISMKMTEADADIDKLMSEMEELTDKIDAGNLWELDRVMERAMDALRLPPPEAKTEVLSGGEKRRVSLCKLLLEPHDMLLLDEPTNHLDAESISWLEQFLHQYKGTVVCITHDRYFLENVAQWILELDRGEGIPFEGNYSQWLQAKASRLAQENKAQTQLAKTISSELDWIRTNPKAKGKKSKARLNRYDDLLAQATMVASKDVRSNGQIYIPPGKRLGDVVIDAVNVRKAFGDRLLFDNLEFSLPKAGIVGVIGPNGAGKTTLIKMLMGKEQPDEGTIIIGETTDIVGVGQERMDELNPAKTVFEEIADGQVDEIELGSSIQVPARAYVSWFGFKSNQQQAIVGNLSGGERNRVQLAKLLKAGANVIILDEPTNDLDVETLRSLEEALLQFAGCAVVVSHDRYFLDRVATHILAFEGDSKCFWFEGNYAEYEENRLKRLGETSIKRIKYAPLVTA